MKLTVIIFTILFPTFCYSENIDDCLAIATKKGISTLFPLKRTRANWDWYRFEITEKRSEYAWISEPGVFEKNGEKRIFKGNGSAFAISLGTANLINNKQQSGSLEELIEKTSKNAYFTEKPETQEEAMKIIDASNLLRIWARVLDGDAIIIGTVDSKTASVINTGNPTHMKMTAVLPYPGESYECFARIVKE